MLELFRKERPSCKAHVSYFMALVDRNSGHQSIVRRRSSLAKTRLGKEGVPPTAEERRGKHQNTASVCISLTIH